MMWKFFRTNRDPAMAQRAEHYSKLLTTGNTIRDVHDLGFIFLNTYRPWYELTGEPASARSADSSRSDVGRTVHAQGAVPAVVRRPGFAVHRHHDERAAHLLRRQGTGDQELDGSAWPIRARRATGWSVSTARRPMKGFSTWRRAISCASRHTRAGPPIAPGLAVWPGAVRLQPGLRADRASEEFCESPSGTPTSGSPSCRATAYRGGILRGPDAAAAVGKAKG